MGSSTFPWRPRSRLKVSSKNAARPWGFTLIELLTVIAIIAVLATLTSATLMNAQRKSRKALSTSNLRQIALAFNLYLDDHQKRPVSYRQLVATKNLSERILLCPEDKIVQNWAGVLEANDLGRITPEDAGDSVPTRPGEYPELPQPDVPHSYFKSFDFVEDTWEKIERSTLAGIAACQLHGIGRQSRDKVPHISDYQGLVLRALKDGSVVPRQIFWAGNNIDNPLGPGTAGHTNNFGVSSQLPLFLDPAE
jgi:prepilin-type N-terminal cleavage/methylation domain-containing protein